MSAKPNEWSAETAREAIETRGAVVSIGQVTPAAKRWLDGQVKTGALVKYRGYWTTLSPNWGMGPLKTIWALDSADLRACLAVPA